VELLHLPVAVGQALWAAHFPAGPGMIAVSGAPGVGDFVDQFVPSSKQKRRLMSS
jgi:hypothetical protein